MANKYVISSDKVEGTNVYTTTGDKLGSIDKLMIDKRSGLVRYALLESGGLLGLGTDRFPLPWSTLKYDSQLDGYLVSINKDQLKNGPRYAHDNIPEYSDAYGQKVYGHYGLQWM